MNEEYNYIYPPVNILPDTYDTTTKARQYFANITKKFRDSIPAESISEKGGRNKQDNCRLNINGFYLLPGKSILKK